VPQCKQHSLNQNDLTQCIALYVNYRRFKKVTIIRSALPPIWRARRFVPKRSLAGVRGLGILKTRSHLITHFPGSSRRRAAATPFSETRNVCRTLLAVRGSLPPFSGATPLSAVAACRSTPLVLPVFLGTLLASAVFANSIVFLGWCAVWSVYLCFRSSVPVPVSVSVSVSLSFCRVSCVLCLVSCVLCLVQDVHRSFG